VTRREQQIVTSDSSRPARHARLLRHTAFALALLVAAPFCARATARFPRRGGKLPPDLSEILTRMNEASKRLRNLTADIEYTKVTVVVNDTSKQQGRLFYRKGKTPEIRIEMEQPDSRIILLKKNRAEIYLPKINQVQEYNLEQKTDLVEGFLLLGFGSDTAELAKSYDLRYLKEEELDGDTTAVLELIPRKSGIASQLTKIHMWINEDSWLPAQQKFFEPGGDYTIARYKSVKVNMGISASTFELHPAQGAKRVKMN
jgi:outer membrane lipoprotein-sorting protein